MREGGGQAVLNRSGAQGVPRSMQRQGVAVFVRRSAGPGGKAEAGKSSSIVPARLQQAANFKGKAAHLHHLCVPQRLVHTELIGVVIAHLQWETMKYY